MVMSSHVTVESVKFSPLTVAVNVIESGQLLSGTVSVGELTTTSVTTDLVETGVGANMLIVEFASALLQADVTPTSNASANASTRDFFMTSPFDLSPF